MEKECQKRLRQERIAAGLCMDCGNIRGSEGTTTMCRTCANKSSERSNKCRSNRINKGLCMYCPEPIGKDGTQRKCRKCADRMAQQKSEYIKKTGIKPNVYICINGVCVNCRQTTETKDEYTACYRCHFKNLARLYLGNSKRWEELRDIWDKQGGICPYTGMQLEFGIDASLDHILPSSRFPELSQEISNLEFIHYQVNSMKRNMTKEEFLEFLQLIHLNLNMTKDPADHWKI